MEVLGVRAGGQGAADGGGSDGVVATNLSLAEGWETNKEVSSVEVAAAEIGSIGVGAVSLGRKGNNRDLSLGAGPVEAVVSSVLADGDSALLAEEALKAGGGLGDSEEESEGEGRFHFRC